MTPRVCYSRPPTEPPKTTIFVEVDEIQLDGKEKRIFSGWMFAESPGLNAVEHPVFDVWLTDCQKPKGAVAQHAPDHPDAAAASDAPPRAKKTRSRRAAACAAKKNPQRAFAAPSRDVFLLSFRSIATLAPSSARSPSHAVSLWNRMHAEQYFRLAITRKMRPEIANDSQDNSCARPA